MWISPERVVDSIWIPMMRKSVEKNGLHCKITRRQLASLRDLLPVMRSFSVFSWECCFINYHQTQANLLHPLSETSLSWQSQIAKTQAHHHTQQNNFLTQVPLLRLTHYICQLQPPCYSFLDLRQISDSLELIPVPIWPFRANGKQASLASAEGESDTATTVGGSWVR